MGVNKGAAMKKAPVVFVALGVSFDKNATTFSISAGLVYALSKPRI